MLIGLSLHVTTPNYQVLHLAIIIKRNIGQEPPETNDTTKRKKRRTKRRGCNTILQLLMPLVATRNQVWSLPLAIAQPLTDTIKMLPFAFDFLGFVRAGAVNWRSKKKKAAVEEGAPDV